MVFKHTVKVADIQLVNPKVSEAALLEKQDKAKNRKLKERKAERNKSAKS